MNTRSLSFRLIAWYAGILTACFVVLGGMTYLVLQRSLVGSLRENQLRRARQIAQLVREQFDHQTLAKTGDEVEARYAPSRNDRFVRITSHDGVVLYLSSAPSGRGFDPATFPPSAWPTQPEFSSEFPLPGGGKLLAASHELVLPGGSSFLIETGAPMEEIQADLKKWLKFLAVLVPVAISVGLGGGAMLVKRALRPVDEIAASAERISSQNLEERLPVPQTGDELERLSLALNRMMERLDSSFRYSRRFVADASHELRTPLTVLQGELESLVQQPGLSAEWRERAGSALEEVGRLSRIVEGLFAISRLDAGEAAADWAPLDLAQLAASTADQMSLLAEDKSISLKCETPQEVWVEGDKFRLKQVVVNLLDNAIKYTPGGGSVALRVGAADGRAVLEVADSGIGIPSSALPRVFDRFYRVDTARSREQGGAGLGLAIVKSICAAHQGSVAATSRPGEGSRFRVELPLAYPSPKNHKSQSNHEH
jgi:heavy metal sensor kinase